ncbi:MAG: NAD(P)-dependent oxidoreductase [Opitutales bacterium]|jgi:3-hydroxyisobutyrate dehydrogenase
MSKPRIAHLGLGIMGTGMARRVLAAGFPLTVYNRNRAKAEALAAEGAQVAATPREAAAQADIVISMVADDAASRALWLGPDGALAAARPDAVLVEASTLTVAWVKELAAAAQARAVEFLDAPVTGTKPHAANGELTFLVGGSAATLEKVRPVLAVMSKAILHVGPTGSGALLKLLNNFLCGVQAASLAEAIAIIEKSGLDRTQAIDFLVNGTPGSPVVKVLASRINARDFTPNFPLRLMAKDLDYTLRCARELGVPLTTTAAAAEVFQRSIAAGHGDKDFSAIVEQFR